MRESDRQREWPWCQLFSSLSSSWKNPGRDSRHRENEDLAFQGLPRPWTTVGDLDLFKDNQGPFFNLISFMFGLLWRDIWIVSRSSCLCFQPFVQSISSISRMSRVLLNTSVCMWVWWFTLQPEQRLVNPPFSFSFCFRWSHSKRQRCIPPAHYVTHAITARPLGGILRSQTVRSKKWVFFDSKIYVMECLSDTELQIGEGGNTSQVGIAQTRRISLSLSPLKTIWQSLVHGKWQHRS